MRSGGRGTMEGWRARDFERRVQPAEMPEWMDEPCSTEVLRGCLRNLEVMNRITLAYRPTLSILERVRRRHGTGELHIVDVGSGYGDMLRVIWRWARRRGVRVRLTGIDMNGQTEAIAREATRAAGLPEGAITWRSGDAMSEAAVQEPDVVLSSLVTHHMSDAEVVRFLRWMERSARAGWIVNDLERQMMPARGFGLLARVLRWHPFLHHDGPVSFRRAFRVGDWEAMLRQAEVPRGAALVVKRFPARLCVERLR